MKLNTYFYTKNRYESLQRVLEKENRSNEKKISFEDPFIKNSKFGTVGCAALDKYGNLAAGTSTGGMTNKRWNRIGDAPIMLRAPSLQQVGASILFER